MDFETVIMILVMATLILYFIVKYSKLSANAKDNIIIILEVENLVLLIFTLICHHTELNAGLVIANIVWLATNSYYEDD